MLINTVILFIRDTLPIFLLFSFLLSLPGVPRRLPVLAIGSGLVMAVMLYFNLSWLSQLADGAGLELLKIATLILAWCSLCVSLGHAWCRRETLSLVPLWLLGVALTVPNAIHFLIYSVAYWPTEGADRSVTFGIIIGLGISGCLATLLYLLITPTASRRFRWLILNVFCAGQIAPIALMLEQIDYLPEQSRLWNTESWVSDESEYGHLFNVLFGYEATPSGVYLLIYALALAGPFIYAAWCKRQSAETKQAVRCL